MTVNNILSEFREKLAGEYPPGEIMNIAVLLFGEYLGWATAQVHISGEKEVPEDARLKFSHALDELSTGKPLQYVTGKAWFNGMALAVDSRVLIPRPETEELCTLAANIIENQHFETLEILDIGTGSGCIALDMKKRFPGALVTGIDSSAGALEIARRNALENGCGVIFHQADILESRTMLLPGKYHAILSNPPYVVPDDRPAMRRNVTDFEPPLALYVPADDPLLFYRAIGLFAREHLVPGGSLFFEINERLGAGVSGMLESQGFRDTRVLRDIHGKDRFVHATSAGPSTLRS